MKINSINNAPYNQSFQGAYIIKGNAKSLVRFKNEISLQTFINPRFPDLYTYPLTANYSKTQPYGEILCCTGEHITNMERFVYIKKREYAAKMKKFADDFRSWSDEKKAQWRDGIRRAMEKVEEGEVAEEAPGERALANGNPDEFLNWYTEAVKNSNKIYEEASCLGEYAFPAKIRRLDADKVADALVCNNFNLKEGFFRAKKAPRVEIDDEYNKMIRYVDGKLDSIMSYEIPNIPESTEDLKILSEYTKIFYDESGKFLKSKTHKFGNLLEL